MPYTVPQNIDPNKIFLVNFSELEGRWDPQFYTPKNLGLVRSITKRVKWKRLKELVSFSTETWNQKDFFEEEFPYVEISEIDTSNGDIRNINFIEIAKAPSRAKMIVHNGDIIISTTRPTRGAISLVNTKLPILIASTGFSVIREVDENVILRTALFIILRLEMCLLQMGQRSSGGNYPAITQDELGKIIIPVPPLHIQQQIVNVYNAALSQRKKKLSESKAKLASIDQYLLGELGITLPEDSHEKTFIVNYKDVDGGRLDPYSHKPYFSSAFENIKRKYDLFSIKQISLLITSGITPLSGSDAYTNRKEGVAFVRSGDIDINGNIDFDNLLYIKHNIHNTTMKASQVQKNDIMIAIVGATIGRIGIYYSNEPANINQAIALVRLKENFLPDYIKEVLQSSIGQLNLDKMKRPVARANINLDEIGQIILPIPPINKQQEIADHISAIRAEAKALEQEANTILEQAKKKIEGMILG